MPSNVVEKTIEEAQAAMTVKRAFGTPFEVGGITILPAARIGGAGAGGGAHGTSAGWGTGFGLVSQPMGVYVIDSHDAHWVPVSTPNPLLAMVSAPITAIRTLLFSRPAWEQKLGQAVPKPHEAAKAKPRAHRARPSAKRVRHIAS
ncbi:MAG: hypothetical protein ACHQ0J_09385 [Candidatus Dormibacterales bacterium]